MTKFPRIDRLPPYVFATVNELKMGCAIQGKDIVDFGMGNPDLATPSPYCGKTFGISGKKALTTAIRNPRYS